ncbi:PREDICTED: uncharacterized protein LOC104352201 [Leptosomus discolor]|uniref:uncharacterized protein LOC104352201 n=1 Tax=Leptosomus discolor TaxID=188344 RepID=UPI000522C4E7|nr:PREDICTED: uncharacterized protein LOC104352201 [Leptosomus discolor]
MAGPGFCLSQTRTCTLRAILDKPEMAKVQYILLVGGFASSIVLRDAVRPLARSITCPCPTEAQVAIAKGAVLFGVNPHFVASRVSTQTYSIALGHKFDAAIHNFCKLRVSKADGCIYCTDLFKKSVGIEESVNINEVAHSNFHPTEPNQTNPCFSFYCTEKQNAQYVDEEGMEQFWFCTVPMPDTKLGKKHQLKIDVKFGITESKPQSWAVIIDFLAV